MEQHAKGDTAHNAGQADEERLPGQNSSYVGLAHTQDIVQAQLLFPALHEEGIGVEQENDGEQTHHKHADGHEHGQVGIAELLWQIAGGGQGCHDVEHGGGAHDGEQVGQVELGVVAQIVPGQPAVHQSPPPVVSTVRESAMRV